MLKILFTYRGFKVKVQSVLIGNSEAEHHAAMIAFAYMAQSEYSYASGSVLT